MIIRKATISDLKAVSQVEQACFPPAEAATEASFRDRLAHYAQHFLLMFEENTDGTEGRLISFVDGFCTDLADLTDEMYADAAMHNEQGAWQMIFGVNTLPEYRRQGKAGTLLKEFIRIAREEGRSGLVLTCKEEKLHWYASFGFENEGVSGSEHGGVLWYQMRLTF